MIGALEEIRDYSTKKHQMQVAHQNTYFLERFGRNDFKSIESKEHVIPLIKKSVKSAVETIKNSFHHSYVYPAFRIIGGYSEISISKNTVCHCIHFPSLLFQRIHFLL